MNQKNGEQWEQELYNLAQSYNEFLSSSIPKKDLFFSELKAKIQSEPIKKSNFLYLEFKNKAKPISNFWEQLFFGRFQVLHLILMTGMVALSIGFYFFYKNTILNNEKVELPLGITLPNNQKKKEEQLPLPKEEILNKEFEKEIIDKILKEENSEKKQKLIQELIDFYKKTKQADKIEEFYKFLE
ncbi:MAG: hypothetical protein ACK4UJ_02685 [Leptonema sp. (in: bacteria)]